MSNYTWKWDLDEKGFVEASFDEYTKCQLEKRDYVEKYLSPFILHTNCGWDHVVYYVLKNGCDTREYVALYHEKENINGRYINVSCNSWVAIVKAVLAQCD